MDEPKKPEETGTAVDPKADMPNPPAEDQTTVETASADTAEQEPKAPAEGDSTTGTASTLTNPEQEPPKEEPQPALNPKQLQGLERLTKKLRPQQDLPLNPQKPVQQPYQPLDYADPNLQLNPVVVAKDRELYAQNARQEEREVSKAEILAAIDVKNFVTTYNNDIVDVAKDTRYKEVLANPKVRAHVDALYEAAVGYDQQTNSIRRTDLRYSDFVEGYFDATDEIATLRSQATAQTVAQQASHSAVTGEATSNTSNKLSRQAIANMSAEEYEKRLPEIQEWLSKAQFNS